MERYLKTHDYTGLKCPLPVLKAKRIIKNLDFNEEHVFICDDPASPIDFKHLCNNEGLKIDITNKSDGKFMFKIMKK